MTAFESKSDKKPLRTLPSPGQVCFGLFSFFCLLLLLRNAEIAMEYIQQGLLLCARMVIPALFPFMILSELLVSGGGIQWIPQWCWRPLERLLRLPRAGCSALLLGWLCGSPVGARCACLAFDRGELTKREAERVLQASCTPSSAFLINAVGISLWGSRSFGWWLYAAILLSALGICIGTGRWGQKRTPREPPEKALPSSPCGPRGAGRFTEAIASATRSILTVCAYVIFFSALMGALTYALGALRVPSIICTLLFCLLEISGGVGQASGTAPLLLGGVLTAFACGWSGLSMHCQVLSICDGRGFAFRSYFGAKLLQGLLCALVLGLVLLLFPQGFGLVEHPGL